MTSLENLESFKAMNAMDLHIIKGGLAIAADSGSKKKDVDSESNDSWKRDNANLISL